MATITSTPDGRPLSMQSDASSLGRVPSRKPVPIRKDSQDHLPPTEPHVVDLPPRRSSLPQSPDARPSLDDAPPIPTASPPPTSAAGERRPRTNPGYASPVDSGRTTPVTQNLPRKGVVRHVSTSVSAGQQAELSAVHSGEYAGEVLEEYADAPQQRYEGPQGEYTDARQDQYVDEQQQQYADGQQYNGQQYASDQQYAGDQQYAQDGQYAGDGQQNQYAEPSFALNGDAHTAQLEESMDHLRLDQRAESYPQLQYHHQTIDNPQHRDPYVRQSSRSASPASTSNSGGQSLTDLQVPRTYLARPSSAHTLGAEFAPRGRNFSPYLSVSASPSPRGSPVGYARNLSTSRLSSDARPHSYIDQLSYMPPAPTLDNSFLRAAVGTNASLLESKQTLEMYRANVKKTNDPNVQHEFAKMLVQMAKEQLRHNPPTDAEKRARQDLLKEAKEILTRAASRGHDESQYYLGDGYFTGLFNKDKEDWGRAYELFHSATKQGHKEAAFRAALCCEFGWGTSIDYAKAREFFRASASWGHPGAATRFGKACITGDLGLIGRQFQREGIRWLGIAARNADEQYNAGPYELGLLHEVGFGDAFYDEEYAAQLYTASAKLGHPEANLRMGRAYELGQLHCPTDAALSIHYYNGAAQAGNAEGMMGLVAWYLVGAPPTLEANDAEAYEWAKRAAERGFAKAQYLVGYFLERGIGCRSDPLEANVWYVKAADQGQEQAIERLKLIREAAAGGEHGGLPGGGEKKKGLFRKLGI